MRRLLVLALLAGCLPDGDTRCAGGLICPKDTVCASVVEWTPVNVEPTPVDRCVSAADLEACRDQPEGTLCDPAGPADTGECHSGVCFEAACGNHFQDAGEACDDANAEGGDGCAADCSSDESCGNGVIDLVTGETCDDGARAARDGCSAGCKLERPRWTQVITSDLTQRALTGMFYDTWRARLVVFGGFIGADLDDTWVGNTAACGSPPGCIAWEQVPLNLRPPPRRGHVMAFDHARGVGVLFGGVQAVMGTLDDMWTWDGRRWTPQAPPVKPPSRERAAMAYDVRREVIVLFGGHSAITGDLGDTWEWNGEVWREVVSASAPPAQAGHAMTYDSVRGRILMFGQGRTWEFDGTWVERTPSDPTPPEVVDFGLAFDVASQRVVLFGGARANGLLNDQTWQWNGSEWSLSTHPSFNDPRSGNSLACDLSSRITVSVGGGTGKASVLLGSSSWQAIEPARFPFSTSLPAMAYDSARDRTVLFLSEGPLAPRQTWERNGSVWTLVALNTGPVAAPVAMTYDEHRHTMVLVTGSELWEWDGSAWIRGVGTAMIELVAVAYDPIRERTVVLDRDGGTFEWNGILSRLDTALPVPRTETTLTFDPERGELVLFGGLSRNGLLLGDTWVLRASWEQRTPTTSPAARNGHAAAWNPARKRVAVSGGSGGIASSETLSDTWEWTGERWEEVELDLVPPSRSAAAMASSREGVVLFGGTGGSATTTLHDTWILKYESNESVDVCTSYDSDGDHLVGCADPDCAPVCSLCGNGTMEPSETCHTCPADFPAGCATPVCGDLACDDEQASCPGDCPAP